MQLLTLTGNLLAERTFTCDGWVPGRTARAREESFQVGGKGINVARMLHRLGLPVTALAFTGGESGAECVAWLGAQPFATHCFPASTPTRTGLVVRGAGQPETTFLGCDAPVDARALAECAAYLRAAPPDARVLALCGSFPGWDAPAAAPLREALAAWAASRVLVVDTYGPPLAWAATQPVALVKINRAEFDALAPATAEGPTEIMARLAAFACGHAPGAWVVTDGPHPVRWATREGATGCIAPPEVAEVSATGSGDVLFASVVAARLVKGHSLSRALAFGIPLAAANAAHPGIAAFDLEPNALDAV